MFRWTFTPQNVLDKILAHSFSNRSDIPDFKIFDPDRFSAYWSQDKAWQRAEQYLASYFQWSRSFVGYPIMEWEILYLKSTVRAIHLAKTGDLSAIHSRLRNAGLPLSQEERDLLADRAEGILLFKRGPKIKNTPQAYHFMSLWFQLVEGDHRDLAIFRTEKKFDVDNSHVHAMIRKIEDTPGGMKIKEFIEKCSVDKSLQAEALWMFKDLFRK